MLGNEHNTLAANHRLQGFYDLKVSAILCQPLMPMEIRHEKRADPLNERGILRPYIGVSALRKLLAFFNRLFLLGGEEDSPTSVGVFCCTSSSVETNPFSVQFHPLPAPLGLRRKRSRLPGTHIFEIRFDEFRHLSNPKRDGAY
ncbi:hypothetical protein [Caballeronia sp. LZ031]|uniref:hypothetical protein n=1 Tax=Caballeronia sp. LZ031 TaxID=3038556 RepID=UPI0028543F9D|nr:hypothetical protein [Caballeronia sp. LZ031]MDR5751052.1 hypothetical protein [Caballeronia sp. LZ024]MDR5844813.1 hypothetical protein [Caballeronia sp. LZ031]